MRPRTNPIGQTYGALTVVADVPTLPGDKREVLARCAGCGDVVCVRLDNLRRAQTRACSECARTMRVRVRAPKVSLMDILTSD